MKKGVIIPRPTSRSSSPIPTLRDISADFGEIDIVDREGDLFRGERPCDEMVSDVDDSLLSNISRDLLYDNICPSPDIFRLSNSAPCIAYTENDCPDTHSLTNSTNSVLSDDSAILHNVTSAVTSVVTPVLERLSSSFTAEIERLSVSLAERWDAKILAKRALQFDQSPVSQPHEIVTPCISNDFEHNCQKSACPLPGLKKRP